MSTQHRCRERRSEEGGAGEAGGTNREASSEGEAVPRPPARAHSIQSLGIEKPRTGFLYGVLNHADSAESLHQLCVSVGERVALQRHREQTLHGLAVHCEVLQQAWVEVIHERQPQRFRWR